MADGAVIRTVAEVMSRPALTAEAHESVAVATSRMRDQGVGSVVVIEGDKPIGILTERDLVRFAAVGGDAEASAVSEWMTGTRTPSAPTNRVSTPSPASPSTATATSRWSTTASSSASCRCATSCASRASSRSCTPGHDEAPKGLEGVVVAETEVGDVRGLEGFYHYRQYNAVDLAEKRSLEDVWHLHVRGHAARPRRARPRSSPRSAPLREIPPTVAAVLPAIAPAGERSCPLDALAHRRVAGRRGARLPAVARRRPRRAAATTRCSVCAVIPTLIMALYRLRHGLEPIAPASRPRLRGQLPLHAQRRGARPRPRPRRRAVPDLHHRPRLQRVDVHGAGHHLDRRRPRRRGRRRRSARCRARCTAARRAGRSTCSTPSARPTTPTPWMRDAVERGDRHHGLRPPRLQDRRPPLACCCASVAERLGGDMVELRQAGRADRGRACSPSSSPAASSTRTSSSTPAS